MGFPNRKELNRAVNKLKDREGTLSLKEDPTPLDKLRWDICQEFVKYKMESKISQKEISEILGIDESKVSKILRHRIDEFSTDRLIKFLYVLDPSLELKVG